MKPAVAVTSVLAVLLGLAATAARADVKFGALYPFSGQLALLGEESARGLEIAVEEINAAGGVQGEKVVLVRGDAVDNNQAIGEARRLIALEKVSAIFGTYSSARSIAASQVAELSGIPYFELGAVADEVTGRGLKFLYRTNPTAEDMAKLAVEMIVNKVAAGLGKKPEDLKLASSTRIRATAPRSPTTRRSSVRGEAQRRHHAGLPGRDGGHVVPRPRPEAARRRCRAPDLVPERLGAVPPAGQRGRVQAGAIIGGGGGYSMQPTADAVGHKVIEGVLDTDFTQFLVNTQYTPASTASSRPTRRSTTAARAPATRSTIMSGRRSSCRS